MRCQPIYIIANVLLIMTSCNIQSNNEIESNLYRIHVGDKYGFIDNKGKIVIEPQYDDANESFSENLCFVTIDGKQICIDRNGIKKFEVADTIRDITKFENGFAKIDTHKEWDIYCPYNGIINKKGKLITISSDGVDIYKDGNDVFIQTIEKDKYTNRTRYYTIDTIGNIIIDDRYDSHYRLDNGLCRVKINGKYGIINSKNEIVVDPIYERIIRNFNEGLVRFVINIDNDNYKIGYINTHKGTIIDAIYKEATPFYEGIARVGKAKHYDQYIDKNGKVITSVDEALSDFKYNRAFVRVDEKNYLIDRHGNKIKQIYFDDFHDYSDDRLATITYNGRSSIIDTMGNIVVNTQYEDISGFNNGYAIARIGNKRGVIDTKGDEIIPVINENGHIEMFYEDNIIRIEVNNEYHYYDYEGHLIWQDIPNTKVSCPQEKPNREDFIAYFDANISSLDPIEGIYYVTYKNYFQDRDNLSSIGLNSTTSHFIAVAKPNPTVNEFWAYWIDGSSMHWVNKFIKLGESNNYAIMKIDKDNDYSSEGLMTLDNPNQFKFRLETGKSKWYNYFVTYDFIRDYPSESDIEMYQRAEWTGTGFAFADGYIATNHHVTNGAKTIRIKGIDGNEDKSYKGYVVSSDKKHDLSIIKIVDSKFDGFGTIPYKLGKTNIDVGDDIFVLGYPMTSSMGNEIKLTDGIISSSSGYKGDESMYQISAPVQPGNSGGPVFNEDGSVVAIVCGRHSQAENANYAIKVSYLLSLINTANLNVDIADSDKLKSKKLSSQAKIAKDFVYLIECCSK